MGWENGYADLDKTHAAIATDSANEMQSAGWPELTADKTNICMYGEHVRKLKVERLHDLAATAGRPIQHVLDYLKTKTEAQWWIDRRKRDATYFMRLEP